MALTGAALAFPASAQNQAPESQTGLNLVQLCVVHRHGARTPIGVHDKENAATWLASEVEDKLKLDLASMRVVRQHETSGKSEELAAKDVNNVDRAEHRAHGTLEGGAWPARLTFVGMKQAIDLGTRLRKEYLEGQGFLGGSWTTAKDHVYVRSTSTERTIETAQGVLTGLFPGQIKKDSPATIYLRDTDEPEWGAPNFGNWCPRLKALWKEGISTMNKEYTDEQKNLLEELKSKVSIDIPSEMGGFMLSVYRDEFWARDAHGKALPQGSDQVNNLLDRLQKSDADRIRAMFSGGSDSTRDEATRLHAGRMLVRIVKNLDKDPDDAHRLILYSGHDWTIMMLLMGLDPDGTDERTRNWPNFCSDLTFERWQDGKTKQEYVRIIFEGEALRLHHLEPHPEFPDLYTKESMHKALAPFLLAEHEIEEACKLPEKAQKPSNKSQEQPVKGSASWSAFTN